MALFLIGIGLGDAKGVTLQGMELLEKADKVYLEGYTSVLNCPVEELEKIIGKKVELADRAMVEQKAEFTILQAARDGDAALLVIGDPLVATTHVDLMQRARKEKIRVEVVHNASIVSAIGATGLQVYKFGKVTSIPFPEKGHGAETPYKVLAENQKSGAHTLILLDLRPQENRFMTVNEAIEHLLKLELNLGQNVFTRDTLCIGCARIGAKDQLIKAGKAKDILNWEFGKPVHCLVVPGRLHFMEEEAVQQFR
jgi:diphthine synthase